MKLSSTEHRRGHFLIKSAVSANTSAQTSLTNSIGARRYFTSMSDTQDVYAQYGPFGDNGPTQQVERYLAKLSPSDYQRHAKRQQAIEDRIKAQHQNKTRPKPSDKLISIGNQPSLELRQLILDLAAEEADKRCELSRNDQCVPFAAYVRAILGELGILAKVAVGKTTYKMHGVKHVLLHAWVEIGEDVVDGNADSFEENVFIPGAIRPQPYWGPRNCAPNRTFKEVRELLADREVAEVHDEFASVREEVVTRFREKLLLQNSGPTA